MRTRSLILPLVLASLCTALFATTDVALYDGGSVTQEDVATYAQHIAGAPYADPLETIRQTTDASIVADATYYLNRSVDEIVWNRAMARQARQQALEMSTASQRSLRESLDQCLLDTWKAACADKISTPSKEELLPRAKARAEQMNRPELRDVSYIFMSAFTTQTAERRAETKARMEDLRTRLLDGEIRFHEAAMRFSEASSARDEGHIGLVHRGSRFNPKFIDFVFALREGELSPVTEFPNGYYLVRIGKVIPEQKLADDDVLSSPPLLREVMKEYRRDAITSEMAQLKSENPGASSDAEAIRAQMAKSGGMLEECQRLQRLMEDRILAWEWFSPQHEKDIEPTEAEIREYYTSFPEQMRQEGQFHLTRYVVPVSRDPNSTVSTQAKAIEVAEQVREALLSGRPLDQIEKEFAPLDFKVQHTPNWVRGSNHAAADKDLLKLSPGGLTGVHADQESAFVIRLVEKRTPPLRPLHEMREYIVQNVQAGKLQQLLIKSQEKTLRELNVNKLWNVPGGKRQKTENKG